MFAVLVKFLALMHPKIKQLNIKFKSQVTFMKEGPGVVIGLYLQYCVISKAKYTGKLCGTSENTTG